MRVLRAIRPIDAIVLLGLAAFVGWAAMNRPPRPTEVSPFAQQVDLRPLDRVAVQADGRLRSFESHAKIYMGYVSGPRLIDGQTNGFTCLDMTFRPERYRDKDVVYVKQKQVLAQILEALAGHGALDSRRTQELFKTKLISPRLLREPVVAGLLERLGRDIIRTSKQVDAIQSALNVIDPRFLAGNLRVFPPPDDSSLDSAWWTVDELAASPPRSLKRLRETLGRSKPEVEVDQAVASFQDEVRQAWSGLRDAWQREDAEAVNAHVRKLAGLFPAVAPELYPATTRLALESWYFRNKSMTWVWWLYAAALVPLLMSAVYRWGAAHSIGMGLFGLAFLGHTASLLIRWHISGRWPNSNMFEAVHTSAWLGGVVALLLEVFTRRAPVRSLFAIASATASMGALMAAYFLPAHLDTGINNKMAALNDVWLYIHTNMIILSYALIAFAFVTALLYLRHRWCAAWDRRTISRGRLLMIPVAVAVLNYTGYLLLMHVVDHANRALPVYTLVGVLGAFLGSTLVLLIELSDAQGRAGSSEPAERSASGGAASLILGGGRANPFLRREGPTAGQVLDGATMILLELSFITLWTGIVMGAIWADHSWGRPWGWDPKEVFALNTFIIFLILVHVRIKVRDKAFWTAVLAGAGFEVMMFNWIVVNFIISGLHSYA